ncbi:hypothetical protein PR001_g27743 [Phytophthora rubi]|uniref:Uncharacterized protein n=1 Tax=Phytophthora rubi TaxID=129364 RepID=A0A6A3HGA5_9STRA|nr:hypothetical protein PR001_g27743 [Phytophthora rubi]
MELRVKSDIFCVQTSTELHQAQDQLDQLRTERQRLSERLAEAEAALESHQVSIHFLAEGHHLLGICDGQTPRSHGGCSNLIEGCGLLKAPIQHRVDSSGRSTSDADDQLG